MINALKNPSFFRPISRPSSPALAPSPAHADVGDKHLHPLNKLSLNNFRRPSAVLATQPVPVTPLLVQDGSYLEMLSLKLSEAVSKALAQPTGPINGHEQLSGKRPLPAGRGTALGALIVNELNSSRDNSHLYRAILRSLHRPLSVLLNNLSALLLPLLASPAFLTPPAPTWQVQSPTVTQVHVLSIVRLAEELLAVFDQLELGTDNDLRGDGLKSIREGLVSLINKVITPLVTGIKNELVPLVESLETPSQLPAAKLSGGAKTMVVYHPSIVALQTVMPLYARALARYTTSTVSQATLATLLISVLWKSLLALSHRSDIVPSPPPSPTATSMRKRRGSPSTTPPATPPPRFMLKLPPSRPPSPPYMSCQATPAADCRALYELVSTLPRPAGDKAATKLAREAVDDALEGLRALSVLLDFIQMKPGPKSSETVTTELQAFTNEIPTLIALPPLLRMYSTFDTLPVSGMLGLSEEEYRKGCLSGFGRAEECANVVGQRVSQQLQVTPESNEIVLTWLELQLDDSV